ncbi:MAG: serine/threonine-protein kinase [Polyangiaceae bacterium]
MTADSNAPQVVGRYAVYDRIASGGMASVHLGRLIGVGGFARVVAIKRLHAQFASDPEFVSMFLDEARMAARIRHPNVVPTLDIVSGEGKLFLVMEWIQGESLAQLQKRQLLGDRPIKTKIACSIIIGALHGLHAAHEARSERGEALNLVHRDVSPQNILVGVDGIPRVLDFGVAKAVGRAQSTRDGSVKGKLRYMSPEQVKAAPIDRRSDLFAAGIVLWEALCGLRLFNADDAAGVVHAIVNQEIAAPSSINSSVPPEVDGVVLRALARDREMRFATAAEMADALEHACAPATQREVANWVVELAGASVAQRAARLEEIERDDSAAHLSPAAAEPAEIATETAAIVAVPRKSTPLLWLLPLAALVVGAAVLVLVVVILRPTHPGTMRAGIAKPPMPSFSTPSPTEGPPAVSPVAPTPSAAPPTPKPKQAAQVRKCNPPYYYATQGGKVIKKWKPGCL